MRIFAAFLLAASASLTAVSSAFAGGHLKWEKSDHPFQILKRVNDAYAAIDQGSFSWNKKITVSLPDGRTQTAWNRAESLALNDGRVRGETFIPHPAMRSPLSMVILNDDEGRLWQISTQLDEMVMAESGHVRAGAAAFQIGADGSRFFAGKFPESPDAYAALLTIERTEDDTYTAADGEEKTAQTLLVELKPGALEAHAEHHDHDREDLSGGLGILDALLHLDLYEIGIFGLQVGESPTEIWLWVDPETHMIVKQRFTVVAEAGSNSLPFIYEITQTEANLDAPAEDRFALSESWETVETLGARKPEIGKPAIDFTLSDLEDRQVTLSDLKGKVVLLDFWATWCGPCIQAMPHLQALYDEYKDEGLLVLGVNQEEPHLPKAFKEENGYTFPTLKNGAKAFLRYQITGIPTTYVINREGALAAKFVGYNDAGVRAALAKAGLGSGNGADAGGETAQEGAQESD